MTEKITKTQKHDIDLQAHKKFAKEFFDIDLYSYQLEFLQKKDISIQFRRTNTKIIDILYKELILKQ